MITPDWEEQYRFAAGEAELNSAGALRNPQGGCLKEAT
jgi:hypothetical protein